MLFLAGLMGVMLVGSFALVAPTDDIEDDDAQTQTSSGEAELPAGDDSPGPDLLAEVAELHQQETALEAWPETEPAQTAQTSASIFEGTAGDDGLTGTTQTDLMNGGTGDDTLSGGANDDELHGEEGDDTLLGGADNDTLHGGAGADLMQGDGGDDQLFGHAGDDSLDGGAGDDELQGGLGDDHLNGADGDDGLHGREGDDTLIGGAGQDTLFAGAGDDLLNGADDSTLDYLNANDGDDTLQVGQGDIATGGAGQDLFVLSDEGLGAQTSTLVDFDATEDQLVVLFDDSQGATPEVSLTPNPDNPGLLDIMLDGEAISTVSASSAPSLADISLVGQSQAASLLPS